MLKRHFQPIFLLLMLVCVKTSFAQEHPYFDFHLSAATGYSGVYSNLKDYHLQGLPSAKFGLQYMYNQRRLYMGTGAEFSLLFFQTNSKNLYDEVDYKDSQNEDLTMRYSFNNFRQRYSNLYINIPITFGYKYDAYYLQGSATYSVHFAGLASTTIDPLKTTGYYPNYIGDLTNMPDHYYLKKDYGYTHSNNLSSQCLLQLEAGIDVTRMFPYGSIGNVLGSLIHQRSGNIVNNRLRLGVFCDIGIGNIYKPYDREITANPQGSLDFINYNINPKDIQFKSVISVPNVSTRINTFFVGIKATWVIRHRDLYDYNR